MGNFSCHSKCEMESSKSHHSELSYSTDSECSAESIRQHFEGLKSHPEYGRFFLDFKTLELGKKISEGAQADVYEARLQTNAPFDKVVKVMKGDCPLENFQSQWPVGMLSAHSKFKLLFDLPLISILGGTLLEDARFAFVMYRRWGDLRLLIERRMKHTDSSPFPIEQAIQLMRSIAEDMKTLHENHDILHRDLKASNVLIWGDFAEDVSLVTTSGVSEKIHTVVADFECSVGVVGTGFWRAPEILQQMQKRVPSSEIEFTRASDVYSYGMTCYEIVTGCIPFDGQYNQELVSQVLQGLRPDLPQDLPEYLRDIILRCWSLDPSQRPNFSELCEMLEKGPNPVSVRVDEEFHKDATVVKVKQWMNPQPLALLEVIQKLIDMDLCLWEPAASYEESGFCYQDFMVTDREGRKISDKGIIDHIRKVLSMPIKFKWITDSLREKNLRGDSFPFTSIPLSGRTTSMYMSGRSRPGLLADVSTILDEMIRKDSSVGVWTSTCGVACVIRVKCGNVEYAKMGLLWDRLFHILQGHDSKEVVRLQTQKFPNLARNMLTDYLIPLTPSGASELHIRLKKTESGGDSFIAHIKYANDSLVQGRVTRCLSSLENLGYGVFQAKIYGRDQNQFLSHKSGIFEDTELIGKGGIEKIISRALGRVSTNCSNSKDIQEIIRRALECSLRDFHNSKDIQEMIRRALQCSLHDFHNSKDNQEMIRRALECSLRDFRNSKDNHEMIRSALQCSLHDFRNSKDNQEMIRRALECSLRDFHNSKDIQEMIRRALQCSLHDCSDSKYIQKMIQWDLECSLRDFRNSKDNQEMIRRALECSLRDSCISKGIEGIIWRVLERVSTKFCNSEDFQKIIRTLREIYLTEEVKLSVIGDKSTLIDDLSKCFREGGLSIVGTDMPSGHEVILYVSEDGGILERHPRNEHILCPVILFL